MLLYVFILNLQAKDLYYVKLYSLSKAKYIFDDALNRPVKLTDSTSNAKKIWISQDVNDEYKVKIHLGEGGEDLITTKDASGIVFLRNEESKALDQYFTVIKMGEYREGGPYVYAFKNKDKYLGYNDQNLEMVSSDSGFNNQKFEFVHVEGKTEIPPMKFTEKKPEPEPVEEKKEPLVPVIKKNKKEPEEYFEPEISKDLKPKYEFLPKRKTNIKPAKVFLEESDSFSSDFDNTYKKRNRHCHNNYYYEKALAHPNHFGRMKEPYFPFRYYKPFYEPFYNFGLF
ncbi:hypothetical protein GVAV_002076 [Gurleya vavrai]